MRLSKLTCCAVPLILSMAAVATPASACNNYTFDHFVGPTSTGGIGSTSLVSETVYYYWLYYVGDRFVANYNLTSGGALTYVNRTISLKYAGVTIFQCNAKTTCPGNNDNIVIHVTLFRTGSSTVIAQVEYTDRQNSSAGAVTTVASTSVSAYYGSNYTLELDGGSTGTNSGESDLTAQFADYTTNSCASV